MAYTTIVSGTNITSSWANASVRDQVVSPFGSTFARNAAIIAPIAGMVSTLTTNTSTEGVEVYNSAGQWRKPWNMPWGYIAQASSINSQAISATTFANLTDSTVNWTSVNRRIYKITYVCIFDCPTNAPVLGLVRLWSGLASVTQANVSLASVGDTATINLVGYVTASSAAAYSITAQAAVTVAGRTFRSNTSSAYPGTMTVEDIGSSGAPA